MVGPPVRRWQRPVATAAAVVAILYIGAMAVSGGRRESRWLVRFEGAAGLMSEAPERIDRVEVAAPGRTVTFVRTREGGWTAEAAARQVPAALASDIELSLRFMHVAAPTRVMPRDEWQGQPLEEFGLRHPQYVVSLRRGGEIVLAGRFGALNPQEVAQYVRVDGREQLYLLPRFVGRQWQRVLDGSRG